MPSPSQIRRLTELEEFLAPVAAGQPFIFVRVDDMRVRDPDTLQPVQPVERTDDDVTGCLSDQVHTERLPGESIDAMCMRARSSREWGNGAVPVLIATYQQPAETQSADQ